MQLPSIDLGHEPKFNLGQDVWIIQGSNVQRKVHKDKVYAIKLELVFRGQKKPAMLACTGYRGSIVNLETCDDSHPPHEVYGTEEEAQNLARWNPVAGVSAEEWELAVGSRRMKRPWKHASSNHAGPLFRQFAMPCFAAGIKRVSSSETD